MNTHVGIFVWMASVCLMAGCSQGADGNTSSVASLESGSKDRSFAASVSQRASTEARLKDRDYVDARALTANSLQSLDQRIARGMNLNASETATFLAIMAEHRAARLALQDVLATSQGSTREERAEQLRTGVSAVTREAASPASVQRRIARELGNERLEAYRELMRTGDRWRFSDVVKTQQVEGAAQKVEVVK